MRTSRLTETRQDLGSQQTNLGPGVFNEPIAELLVFRPEPAPVGISGFRMSPSIIGVEQGLEVNQRSRVIQFEQLAHGAPALAHISVREASGVLPEHGGSFLRFTRPVKAARATPLALVQGTRSS